MWFRMTAALAAALIMAGCASLPPDRGRAGVDALASARNLPVTADREADTLAARLLEEPLGPDDAVRVALLRNASLRAEYARLGVTAAEVYDAGRLENPRLSGSRLDSDESGALDLVTFGLSQSLASLITLGDRSAIAEAALSRAQAETAAAVFDTAIETARAWYRLAAATEQAAVAARIADAADASAELAKRFFEAGNLNRLELAERKSEAAEARVAAVDARAAVDAERAALGTLMGLNAAVPWRIRAGLPEPRGTAPQARTLKHTAAESRLDLVAAQRRVRALEKALDVTRRWRWLGDPELEVETERETDGSRLTGAGLSLEIPLFDQHADEVARGEARLDAAYAMRDALASRASHELALALARVEASKQRLDALATGLLPERRARVEEAQKQVNYMLKGVFELVETRKAEYRSIGDYLEAVRDHWLARLALDRAAGRWSAPPGNVDRITAEGLMGTGGASSMPGMDHGSHESEDGGRDDAPTGHGHHH